MEEAGAARRRSGRSGGEGRTGLAMEKAVWSGAKRGAANGEDTKTVKKCGRVSIGENPRL
jgi:hypothetical protein